MVSSWTTTTQQRPGVATEGATTAYMTTYQPNHAYVPVTVRQGFSSQVTAPSTVQGYVHPSPAASSTMTTSAQQPEAKKAEPATPGKVVWPESVRNYVSRSFHPENDDPTVSRQEVEAKLKEVIRTATDHGTLFTINWNEMASPQAMIKAARLASAGQALFSKKRKSADLSDDTYQSSPSENPRPGTTNTRSSLQDRITVPATLSETPKPSKFQKEANKRKRRFETEYRAFHGGSSPTSESAPPPSGPIVGTCQTLEKRYLRLTAPPVASMVRPESVLQQTLDFLKKKWRKEGNYSYICDQFKSMRQDLTVQHVKNDFTVSVYEIHARIALEKGDIGEYNQCQTQLRSLYALGLKGNPIEFKAYRILYFIHTANRSGLNDTLTDLTASEKKERPIRHALNVRSSLALGNYHRFFQLYLDTPNMGAYLMDMFIVRERLAALCNICRAYKPDVKLRFITEELGFESDADAAQFIIDYKGQDLLEDRTEYIAFLAGKAGSLFEGPRAAAFQKVDIKGQI